MHSGLSHAACIAFPSAMLIWLIGLFLVWLFLVLRCRFQSFPGPDRDAKLRKITDVVGHLMANGFSLIVMIFVLFYLIVR